MTLSANKGRLAVVNKVICSSNYVFRLSFQEYNYDPILYLFNVGDNAFNDCERYQLCRGKRRSPLDGLYDCAKIESNEDRLACFDSVAASLQIKEEKKEIVALDAESAKTIKKEAFGFNLPSLPKLGLAKIGADKDIESITEPVKSVNHMEIITLFDW